MTQHCTNLRLTLLDPLFTRGFFSGFQLVAQVNVAEEVGGWVVTGWVGGVDGIGEALFKFGGAAFGAFHLSYFVNNGAIGLELGEGFFQ